VQQHLEKIRPLFEDEEIADALQGVRVMAAPPGAKAPRENELLWALGEAVDVPTYSMYKRGEHYSMLREWAIYLTKCDEVMLYLVWPTLDVARKLPADTPEAGLRLWSMNLRDRFWFKDNDPATGIVYVKLPGSKSA
jgi:hypothetical protein